MGPSQQHGKPLNPPPRQPGLDRTDNSLIHSFIHSHTLSRHLLYAWVWAEVTQCQHGAYGLVVRAVMGDVVTGWGSPSLKPSCTCALMLHVLPPVNLWIPESWTAGLCLTSTCPVTWGKCLCFAGACFLPRGCIWGFHHGWEDRWLKESVIHSFHKGEGSRQMGDLGLGGPCMTPWPQVAVAMGKRVQSSHIFRYFKRS